MLSIILLFEKKKKKKKKKIQLRFKNNQYIINIFFYF